MADDNKTTNSQNSQEVTLEDLPVEDETQDDVKGGVPHLIRIIE